MNCCNDFGNCCQGRDCPARQQPYPFTDIQPTDDEEDGLISMALQLAALLGIVFFIAFGLGYLTGTSS